MVTAIHDADSIVLRAQLLDNPSEPSGRVYVDSTEQAMAVRRAWMKLMGMSDEEIEECCDQSQHPAVLEEELESLYAIQRVAVLNRRP